MRMVWLKLYDEILEDRKVQTLSGDAFKFWVNVLAIANRQKVRGVLPPVEDVAFLLRLSVQEATANLAQLVSLGIIDETPAGLSPHNWAERQKKTDATSTERSRKHREKRDGAGTVAGRVASPSRTRCTTVRDDRGQKCNEMQRTDKSKREEEYIRPASEEKTKPVEAKSTPPQGELVIHQIPSQTHRTPEDLEAVHAAEKILAGDLRTESLAFTLGREHNLPAMVGIAGWKWIRAAEKMVGPGVTDSQRRTFNYFAKIAANLTDAERNDPRRFATAESKPEKPTVYYKARRRTPEELERAYSRMGSIAS